MKKIEVFFPFTKIDIENREVWGRITQEAPDKSKEVFDYESSVPFFKAWNEEFAGRTDGESVGNVREMHQLSAVGIFKAMDYNDAELAIDAGCKVTDDDAWQKVLDKVYTGFSIGGGYVKKWKDGDMTRYTAKPSEVSLVDNPCLGKAVFTQIIKMDGADEQVTLGELRKGMWDVADFAGLIRQIGWMAQDAAWEAEYEGDDSPVPASLRDWLAAGAKIFQDMAAEEIQELLATLPAPPEAEVFTMAAKLVKGEGFEDLVKAKFTATTKTKLDTLHKVALDAVNALAEVWTTDAEPEVDADKGTPAGDLQKVQGLTSDIQKAQDTIATLTKRVTELEAQPTVPKGVINANSIVVAKDADTSNPQSSEDAALKKQAEEIAKLPPEEQTRLLIKAVHMAGTAPR